MSKRAYLMVFIIAVLAVTIGVFGGAYGVTKAWIPVFEGRLTEDEVRALVVEDLVEMKVMQYPFVVDFTCEYLGDGKWSGSCVEQWGNTQPTHY